MSQSAKRVSISGSKRKLLLALFAAFLIAVTAIVTIIATRRNNYREEIAAHSIVKASCSAALYPQLCLSEISAVPQFASKIKSPKHVIEASLNITISAVQHNYFTIKKLITTRKSKLTKRERNSLHDCLEMVDETLDELYKTEQELGEYPKVRNKSINQQADDLKILLSAAMTNQETCLDGFSHDRADKKV